jgi:EAL domain-containing protein (putative c-di-GMP-specific phosphodiesterase class I)
VTEGLIIADIHQAIATMSALKVLGIHFSIDDFGTGYSSLAYLKRLLLNELKIDQCFVQDLPGEVALIEAIIALARHFKFAIVAEGVETIEQANFLQQRGCDFYQGYLYGKPMPMAEFDLMRIGTGSVWLKAESLTEQRLEK